ncbi:MAG TPA: hypothetical protein VFQ16_05395 [Burkholderiaceae bacterium]|nr:hypothetical protein [Burkholderiaceae bacterium]
MTFTVPGLWPRIRDAGMATVAVMGMAKNTGKTVALNHLLACAARERAGVGLTSIGRDGEDLDAVFSIPKPPVVVWPGTVVATARDTLLRARVRTRMLAGTGIASPMGEIVLVKALDHGDMEVAGASRSVDQIRTIELLRRCGAERVFLDGALGRSQHASPAVADGVLLATGAAVGGGLGDVLRKTRDRLAILGLPALEGAARAHCAPLFDAGTGVGLWARDGSPIWQADIASLNAAEALLERAAGHDIGLVAVTGAVGRRLWRAFDALAERHPGLQVVVADGTRLFVDAAELAVLQQRGARVAAWRAIRLAGVTTNPFSPLGGHLDATELRDAARAAFPDHAVHDVVLEEPTFQDHRHGPVAA